MGGKMINKGQMDTLNKNYDELEEDGKEKLLKIGEKLLDIQSLVINENQSDVKNKKNEFKNEDKK